MRYRRQGPGGGPAVLLLHSPGDAERLARTFRVIVPEPSDPQGDAAAWLAAFLEGLGARGITIVAEGPFHDAAVELARCDPDRVARVVRRAGELLGGG